MQPIPIARSVGLKGLLAAFSRERLSIFRQVFEECGEIAAFGPGRRRIIQISSAELSYQVLVEQAAAFEKGPGLRLVSRPLLGNGLLTAENQFQRRQRKLMAPAFTPRRVANHAATMVAYADAAQRSWRDGQVIDLPTEMMRLTLGIAGQTLFSADVLGEAHELGAEITQVMRHAGRQLTAVIRVPYRWPTPANRRSGRAIERLDRTVYRMITERRARGMDGDDFLSMLLHAQDEDDGSRMTDKQVRDEAMTIFLAGHETTANALIWTLLLLAQHPNAAEQLRREVSEALGGRIPTYEDLGKLPITLQSLKEGLRLFPPAYAIGRQATSDVQIGDYLIPAGAIVILVPYVLHRRSDYFQDPDEFRPGRFAGDAEKRLPRGAYLPFSDGPRNCIGSHFALMEGQLVLATFAQRVRLELIPGQVIQPEPLITLRPRSGIAMRVRREEELPAH